MNFKHWFHHLFNPHCAMCEAEKLCRNCDVLMQLLEQERADKMRLLDKILVNNEPEKVSASDVNVVPIGGKGNWYQKKRELEMKAQMEAEKNLSIEPLKPTTEELESIAGVTNG